MGEVLEDQPYVFISYSHKDSAIVLPILEQLKAGGMRLWNKGFTGEQSRRNGRLLYTQYAHRMAGILQRVADSNTEL